MSEDFEFFVSVPDLPEGQALTFEEMEKLLLGELKKSGGTSEQTLFNLAYLYSEAGRQDLAVGYVKQLLEVTKDPEKRAAGTLTLGQLMEQTGDFRNACVYYEWTLGLEPGRKLTRYLGHNNLGYSLNQLGRTEEAEPHFRQAISVDPQRPNAYKNLGLTCEALGRPEEAAECYVRATKADASDTRAFSHLTTLVERRPDLLEKVPHLRRDMERCRKFTKVADGLTPDFGEHWRELREKQKPPWWKFWKRR